MKREFINVAGVTHYEDNILKLMRPNADFLASSADLKDVYGADGTRIYQYVHDKLNVELVPEPTNKYDTYAIQVIINGLLVGYVKKGSCSHVRNLIQDEYFTVSVNDIGIGQYKAVYDTVDTVDIKPFVKLCLQTGKPDVKESAPHDLDKPTPKIKKPSKKLIISACVLWGLFGAVCLLFAPIASLIIFIIIGIVLFKNRGNSV